MIAGIDEGRVPAHGLRSVADQEGRRGAHVVDADQVVLGRSHRGPVPKFLTSLDLITASAL
jgi:hypothetical protein